MGRSNSAVMDEATEAVIDGFFVLSMFPFAAEKWKKYLERVRYKGDERLS